MSRGSMLRVLLRPTLLALHAFAVVAIGFTVVMGMWQLGVYDGQQRSERAEQQDAAPIPLGDALGADDAFPANAEHQAVRVRGEFAPENHEFWVSGRESDGRDGYWRVAPFLVAGEDDTALLVVRGWSPDRATPPRPAATGRLEVVLQPTEQVGSQLGAERTTDAVAVPQLANELPYNLYAGFGIQADPEPAGLRTVDPPSPDVSWTVGLRNLVYAMQWWAFGIFAVFLWLRMCRDLVRESAGSDQAQEALA